MTPDAKRALALQPAFADGANGQLSLPTQFLPDCFTLVTGGNNGLHRDGLSRREGFGDIIRLWIFPLGKSQATMKISSAAIEQLSQPQRASPGIDSVEQAQ